MTLKDGRALLELLADGQLHSGEALGQALNISRAAVWKRLQGLSGLGLQIEKVKGQGYRIPNGLDLLTSDSIESALSDRSRALLNRVQVFDNIASTNEYLLRHDSKSGDVCLAEQQTAGRGRRGRCWQSPFAQNLYLSICWHYHQGVGVLEGLSLAVGVEAAEALRDLGCDGVQLKWPNDLLWQSAKLGGILIEVGGDVTGECKAVVGIGINVSMSDAHASAAVAAIDQPWVDLKSTGLVLKRNDLCAALLTRLLPALAEYPRAKFAHYRDRWQSLNAHYNQRVTLTSPSKEVSGQVLGVDDHGALRLSTNDGEKLVVGGEISLQGHP